MAFEYQIPAILITSRETELRVQMPKVLFERQSLLFNKGKFSYLSNMNDLQIDWAPEVVSIVHELHQRGWAPATSGNYSWRTPGQPGFLITASGLEKGKLSVEDFIEVNARGESSATEHRKTSAETLLHAMVYDMAPESNCVLHTHSLHNSVLSRFLAIEKEIVLSGWELLKAIEGINSHRALLRIPIFANSQDIPQLAQNIRAYWEQSGPLRAFLLAGHGLYTWGSSPGIAARQLEALEFLIEAEYAWRLLPREK